MNQNGKIQKTGILFLMVALMLLLLACGGSTNNEGEAVTQGDEVQPTQAAETAEATQAPEPTEAEPTEEPTATAEPSATPEPTEEPTATAEPTEEPFSLTELQTLEQVESINSYRLLFTMMATADDEALAEQNIEMTLSSALVKDPKAFELKMEGAGLGVLEFRETSDKHYMNQGEGWLELPDAGLPANFIDEMAFISPAQIAENISALEEVGRESLNGRETVHFRGNQESLVQILGQDSELDADDLSDATLDLWIDQADVFMVKLEFVGSGLLDDDNPDLTGQIEMLIEYADFNEEIVIEAPEISDAEGTDSTDSAEEGTEAAEEDTDSAEAAESAGVAGTMACFGTYGFGISCLSESGWASFNEDDSPLGDNLIFDMALCPDNTLLIAHNFGISAFDGQNWTEYGQEWGSGSVNGMACDANGGIWVAHFKGVTYFDGESWTTTPSEELATGDDANDQVKDVTLGPDGQVWVSTVHTIASTSDGSQWSIYQQGQGFEKQYFLNKLAVDGQGGLWVIYNLGLLYFDGSTWTDHKNSDISTIQDLVVDNEGLLWFGTTHDGLGIFDGQSWAAYDTSNSGLLSNHVRSITIDAQGRFWLGTEWGLVIFDGTTWQTYQMDSAQLADNDIRTVAVVDDGPALPELIDEENGSLKGQLLNANEEPIANAAVELCVQSLSYFFTESPCEDQPFVLQTTTDADGNFAVTDMPVGRYVMSANIAEEQWVELEKESGFGSRRILINAGEETDLSTLIFEAEDS